MGGSHVISGLVEERAKHAGQVEVLRKQLEQAEQEIEHIDAVIKLIGPTFNLGGIRAKRTRTRTPGFKRGELTERGIDTLRDAGEPRSVEDVCAAIVSDKGEVDASKLRNLVRTCLRSQEQQGVIRRTSVDGKDSWVIAA